MRKTWLNSYLESYLSQLIWSNNNLIINTMFGWVDFREDEKFGEKIGEKMRKCVVW